MSVRAVARASAASAYFAAAADTAQAVQEIRRFRWTNAHLLALEAAAMIERLRSDNRVAFRGARLGYWRSRYRRFAAKAYAIDHVAAWRAGITGSAP